MPARPKKAKRWSHVCAACGSKTRPRKHCPGSIVIEVAIWIMFLPVGLLYSIWRHTKKIEICRECRSPEIYYAATPRGRDLLFEHHGIPVDEVLG